MDSTINDFGLYNTKQTIALFSYVSPLTHKRAGKREEKIGQQIHLFSTLLIGSHLDIKEET